MGKKLILFFPFDLLSHYLRCIELARNYPDHQIKFAASKNYSSFVREAGFEIFDVEHFDADYVMKCAVNFNFNWINESDIERVFLSQLKIISQQRPAFVIGDTSPSLKMAAEKAQVKYVSLMNNYMSKYYALTRPVPDNHYSNEYLKKLPPGIGDKITSFAERLSFIAVHKPFRKLRKKYGLKKIFTYLSEMEGDENLLCDDPLIFPLRKLPPNYKVIGPILFKPHSAQDFSFEKLDVSKPVICVSLGSSGNWDALKFLNKEEFANLNIIVAGDKNKILSAPYIHSYEFIDLNTVLPNCDYLICHGGNGTIYLGLQHKIQMLFLTNHFEQEWNAKRLEELGYGRRINSDPEQLLKEALLLSCGK